MRLIPWFFLFSSSVAFSQNLECVVNHSGRGTAKFEITGTGAYVVDTPYKSQVVVAAQKWNHHECATKTCYALIVGLVKNRTAAASFVSAFGPGGSTWADTGNRVGPHTTAFASTLPVLFERGASIGYGHSLSVRRTNHSIFGGTSVEEASLSCRLK